MFSTVAPSLIFLKSGRETEKCGGGVAGGKRGSASGGTTDRYKIRAVILLQSKGCRVGWEGRGREAGELIRVLNVTFRSLCLNVWVLIPGCATA